MKKVQGEVDRDMTDVMVGGEKNGEEITCQDTGKDRDIGKGKGKEKETEEREG